jgi:hypothetical protein
MDYNKCPTVSYQTKTKNDEMIIRKFIKILSVRSSIIPDASIMQEEKSTI